jgi:hypothetical protein
MFRFIRALRESGWSYLRSLVVPAAIGGGVVGVVYAVFPLEAVLTPMFGGVLFDCFTATAATL